MADDPKHETQSTQPTNVEIRIKGHLDEQWAGRFEALTITLQESGDTLLTGPFPDQAALFGLLRRVRDLGLQLISVNRVDTGKQENPTGKP